MKLKEAKQYIESELVKQKLSNFNIILNRSTTVLGACYYIEKVIVFSEIFIKNSTLDQLKIIVAHEFAHAKVGIYHGHNSVWKEKCIELGGTGKEFEQVFLGEDTCTINNIQYKRNDVLSDNNEEYIFVEYIPQRYKYKYILMNRNGQHFKTTREKIIKLKKLK
jgi:predicted SprT family Zn-dependent metalloprotease